LISFNLINDWVITNLNNRKLRWKIDDIVKILSWVLGGLCFILSLITLHFLIKAFKKIKKSREKLKNQNDDVKKNLRWAGLSTLFHLIIPMILTIWLIIWVACCFYISI
jgi:beta-lactamase regulating signal transducer with metallopeptidase domain